MAHQIEFSVGNTSFMADLMEKEAPKTCNMLWKALPLESDAHHAKFAGSEVFFGFRNKINDELENKVYIYDLKAGDIAIRGSIMIICYGPMQHEIYPTNLIASTSSRVSDLEALKDACKRAFRKPGDKIVIERKI